MREVCGGCPEAIRTGLNPRRVVHDALDENMLDELASYQKYGIVTCNTCSQMPQGLKRLRFIGLRNILVEGGVIQPTVRDALESAFREGNPGMAAGNPRDWMKDLDVSLAEPGEGGNTYLCMLYHLLTPKCRE